MRMLEGVWEDGTEDEGYEGLGVLPQSTFEESPSLFVQTLDRATATDPLPIHNSSNE